MTLGPVISGSRLAKNKVVWSENLSKRSRSDWVHGTGFKIDQDGAGDVLATGGLIVVDIDAFQLKLRGAVVGAGGVDAVLVGDDLPELENLENRNKIFSYLNFELLN